MMKKLTIGLLVLTLLLAMLTGCGGKQEDAAAGQSDAQSTEQNAEQNTEQNAGQSDAAAQPSGDASAAENETETGTETAPETADVHPYAWLGLQDMPKCNYLDIMSTNNYVQVYDTYVYGIKAEVTEASKGLKSYKKNGNNLTLNIEGMIYSINQDAKQYLSTDMTGTIDTVRENMEKSMAEGINTTGRVFQGTGKSAIPVYSEKEGDATEYEYYEYLTESDSTSLLERFFLKDGDVFASYSKTTLGETELETTEVVKSVSADVPDDLFVVPDLSDYTNLG